MVHDDDGGRNISAIVRKGYSRAIGWVAYAAFRCSQLSDNRHRRRPDPDLVRSTVRDPTRFRSRTSAGLTSNCSRFRHRDGRRQVDQGAYVAERHEIAARCKEWEITGLPDAAHPVRQATQFRGIAGWQAAPDPTRRRSNLGKRVGTGDAVARPSR